MAELEQKISDREAPPGAAEAFRRRNRPLIPRHAIHSRPGFRQGQFAPGCAGPARRRLSRTAHHLPIAHLHDTLHLERTAETGHRTARSRATLRWLRAATRENLVWRAADALRRELKLPAGVRIELRQAHSGGPRAGRRIERRGRGAGGLAAPDADGESPRSGCWRSPRDWARTCPFSCSAGARWERAAATRSTRFPTAAANASGGLAARRSP